ncbi:MAG: flagellar basal-body MS-ring/collar protein FliF [Desulfobacterota bacterium]|nr:flagellar basal-body MS-ring/collar protein FliF [Thermodesulfobacteriota bacterium]
MADSRTETTFSFLNLLPKGRRWILLLVLLLSLVLFGSLIFWNTQPDYQVLFSGLSTEDAAEMTAKLKEKRIPFRLAHHGTTLLVPSDQVYDLRLSLAAEGLPKGGGVGFEVFDRSPIGATDFVQKLNYQRALQGELSRTIKQIKEVDQVRVHIATPRESLFTEEQKKPTASVFIKTKAGMALNPSQVEGIVHLVACAVEGLEPTNISVIDTSGRVLSRKAVSHPIGQLTSTQLEYQHSLEESLRKKVQSMLEEVLGPGKAIARISTEIDFQQVVVSEEKYDPNAILRSEQRNVEKPSALPKATEPSKPEAGGDAKGAAAGASSWSASLMERQNEIRNYEISKVNRQIKSPMGGIKRVSAAVVVDGIYKEEVDAKGVKERKYTPRSPEEMKHLESIVKRAIGYDEGRGDQVEVINLPFYWSAPEEDSKGEEKGGIQSYLPLLYKPGISLILVLLFLLFVVRPLLKRGTGMAPAQPVALLQGGGPATVSPETSSEAVLVASRSPREQALQLVQKDPAKAVGVIRTWLREKE